MTGRAWGHVMLTLAPVLLLVGSAGAQEGDDKPGALERDPFQVSVAEAIQKGTSFLNRSLRDVNLRRIYPLGQRALYAYALLESGSSPDAPLVERLFREMDEIPLRKTYSVAVYALALDASLRKDPSPWPKERKITPRREKLFECVDWLVKARFRERGLWGYEKQGRQGSGIGGVWVDFSATQFAGLALQVALRNGMKIPTSCLEEVLAAHIRAAQPMAEGMGRILCQGGGWWTDSGTPPLSADARDTAVGRHPVIFTSSGFAIQGVPRGWPYRPAWNRTDREPGRPSYSMTAAAVGTLIVTREGLVRAGKLKRELLERVDRLIAEGMLTLSRDWDSMTPTDLDSLLRNYYYTLYCFEKAMDLGGVVTLGGIDWYPEQARLLMATQRRDGGWGHRSPKMDPHYDRVSTSFALLFLCRATRNLRIEPPDPILTALKGDKKPTGGVRSGRVYLPSRQGMVSLSELFGMLADSRTPDLLEVGREVVKSVPPREVPELLPYLVELRASGSRDVVYKFARDSIAEISGLDGDSSMEDVERWLNVWRQLLAWGEARADGQLGEIAGLVRNEDIAVPLRVTGIDTLLKIGALEAVPALMDALGAESVEVRESSHRALRDLTLERVAFDPRGPTDRRAEGITRWRLLWSEKGGEMLFSQKWQRLRGALDRARAAPERARLRAEIVALGKRALADVETILSGERYAFDWVLIREALTGERRGI